MGEMTKPNPSLDLLNELEKRAISPHENNKGSTNLSFG
jgi:hypothetical protein